MKLNINRLIDSPEFEVGDQIIYSGTDLTEEDVPHLIVGVDRSWGRYIFDDGDNLKIKFVDKYYRIVSTDSK